MSQVAGEGVSRSEASGSGTLELSAAPRTSLVDLLDRVLATGVVLDGDVTISLAGVDLITVRLRALISTVREEWT